MKDERTQSQLAEAITLLVCELRSMRDDRNREIITKADLAATEKRIIAEIKAGGSSGGITRDEQRMLDELSERTRLQTRKLEKLDALTLGK